MAQQILIGSLGEPRKTRGTLATLWSAIGQRYGLLLFILTFVLPMAWALVFYGLIASDRFISEARFTVRGVNGQQMGGLSVLLRTFGMDRSNDDAFAVHDYIQSRDAVEELQKEIDLRAIFSRPESDYFTRFGNIFTGDTEEALYRHYLKRVDVEENMATGITTVRVHAYRPDDAKLVAEKLLQLSEKLVNGINTRARSDSIDFAQENLKLTGDEVIRTQIALTRFRNDELLINPEQAAQGNFEVIATLSQSLVQEQVRLQQMAINSPSNPNIGPTEDRIRSLEQQIDIEKSKLTGSDEAISNKLGRYEELLLRRTLADKAYETAILSIDSARQDAVRKQIYLEAVIRPHLPDESRDPLRLRMIFTVLVLSLAVFVMTYILVAGSREHLNFDT